MGAGVIEGNVRRQSQFGVSYRSFGESWGDRASFCIANLAALRDDSPFD
jgi:hypothetical protein